jgi:hypothetical protein
MVILFDQIMAASGLGFRDSEEPISVGLAFGLTIIFAPIAVIFILVFAVLEAPGGLWGVFVKNFIGPFKAPESEWIDQEPKLFVADMVRERRLRDPRLKKIKLGSRATRQFDQTPEAMILDLVTKYLAVRSAGLPDQAIWEKMEAHLFVNEQSRLPSKCDLEGYVEYRLGLRDPDYLGLGSDFIRDQIGYCRKYVDHRSLLADAQSWPPNEWLGKELTLADFETLGDGLDLIEDGAPAVLNLSDNGIGSDLSDLKFLMLPGDEFWTFSSPPETWKSLGGRGGVVLMRDGLPVGHVLTMMN